MQLSWADRYRTALITGASSGIGRALAIAVAKRGTKVYCAARRQDELLTVVSEISAQGGRAEAVVLDVSDGDATVEQIAALDAKDPLDLVVVNAGVALYTPATRFKWSRAKQVLQVNLLGATATVSGVLPQMVERNRGHLVGIASLAGLVGLPVLSTYSASKAGMIALFEGLRIDLQQTAVDVTTVLPGFVSTPMNGNSKTGPFVVDTDFAVDKIIAAIDKRQARCAFPSQVAWPMRTIATLPAALYEFALGRFKLFQ